MRNLVKLVGIIAFVVVIGLGMTACDNGNDDPKPQTVTYSGTADGSTYTLKITEASARYTAQVGDSYVLTVTTNSTTKTSSGTVTTAGNTLELTPSFSGAPTFEVTVSTSGITGMDGEITFNDGEKATAPTTVTPGNGTGGNVGGTFTVTGIPNTYNGKYALIMAGFENGDTLLGAQSINFVTGTITLAQISNGSVSLSMWRESDGSVTRFSDSCTVSFVVNIFNGAYYPGDEDNPFVMVYFESVAFSNGNATKKWSDGQVDYWD